MTIPADLEGAVGRNEIVAYYQPQIDTASGRIVALESLARWNHPQSGLVQPQEFIPHAEDTGLIIELGDFMLDEGCRCASIWRGLGHDIEISVNVSALQLGRTTFFDRLAGNLRDFELGPHCLTIEITETRKIQRLPEAARRLDYLRNLGVSISIDDFGVGESSLERMLDLPATELKIDKSLIHGTRELENSSLEAIVELAHDRGVRVVAEGIETQEHLDRALALNCDRSQGYFIAVPMPESSVVDALGEAVA